MFSATITDRAAETVIELEGELDIAAAPHLVGVVQGVLNAGGEAVLLDLAALDFVDSTGLSAIARLSRRASERGGRLVVRNPSELATRVISLTGIDMVVDVRQG